MEGAHAAEVNHLRAAIRQAEEATAAAHRELAERPVQEVERYLDHDVLEGAKREAQRAFQSRQRAWGALCEIGLRHRETPGGRCRCGLRWSDCATAEVVGAFPHLERWERQQARRLVDDLPHGLPASHPAVLDAKVARRLAAIEDAFGDDPYDDEFLQANGARPKESAAEAG